MAHRAPFADQLKRARKRTGLTQADLGRKAGLTGSYISMIESGRKPPPRPKVIARLAKSLGVAEKPLQDAAALERAPLPLRKRLEDVERAEGSAQRSRDRLLSSTLFHIAHRGGPVHASSAYLDMSPGQRSLLSRLLGRVRSTASAREAENRSGEVLEDASPAERDMLAGVLPHVLAPAEPAGERTDDVPDAPAGSLPVYATLAHTDAAEDHIVVDPRHYHVSAFLWRIAGDDAYPTIEAGDLVLVDPVAEPRGGDLVAFHHDGHDLVRTLHLSDAEARLEPPRADLLPIRIPRARFRPAGVVVWLSRQLR